MTQRITKRSLLTGVIIICLMMVYSLVFCLYGFFLKSSDTPNNIDANMPTLWVTYIITMIVFAIAFVTSVLAFERPDLRSRVFGIPIVLVGFGAICIQILVDAVVMVLGFFIAFNDTAWVFILIPESIFIVCIIIMIIVRQAYRGLIEAIDKQGIKTNFTTELLIAIEMICKENEVPKLDKELTNLYEGARYTDPVSIKEVQGVEDEISKAVDVLRSNVATGDAEEAVVTIGKIKQLLSERSLRLKAYKTK